MHPVLADRIVCKIDTLEFISTQNTTEFHDRIDP